MEWQPVIEYVDESDIVLPPPVRKQVWDGEKFFHVLVKNIKHCLFMMGISNKLNISPAFTFTFSLLK